MKWTLNNVYFFFHVQASLLHWYDVGPSCSLGCGKMQRGLLLMNKTTLHHLLVNSSTSHRLPEFVSVNQPGSFFFFFGKSWSSGNILQYVAGAWRHIFWVTLKEVAWSMIGSKGFKEGLSFLIQQELGLGMVLERFRKYAFFSSRKLHMDSDLGHHDNPPSKQSVAYSSSYYSREMLLLTAAILLLWSYGG